MRLLLLPISTRRTLIYCEPPSSNIPAGSQSYLDKAVAKASQTWADWEKSDKGWKLKATHYGNNMLRRIPFEEWGLKSIPPLKKVQKAEARQRQDDGAREALRPKMVEVKFPGIYQGLCKESVTEVLKRLATERQGLHQKRLWWSLGAMPLTIPFGLLPVIPNIPFFYLAYRAFSHWRALLGSRHLEHLVSKSLITPSPSSTLDSLYTTGLLHPTRQASRNAPAPTDAQNRQVSDIIRRQLASSDIEGGGKTSSTPTTATTAAGATGEEIRLREDDEVRPHITAGAVTVEGDKQLRQEEEILLLRAWNGKLLAERLKLPGLEIEIERAVEQVERDLKRGKELREERKGLDKAAGEAGKAVQVEGKAKV